MKSFAQLTEKEKEIRTQKFAKISKNLKYISYMFFFIALLSFIPRFPIELIHFLFAWIIATFFSEICNPNWKK